MNSIKKKVCRIIAATALVFAAVLAVPFFDTEASAAGVKGVVKATELRVRKTPDMSNNDNVLTIGDKEVLLKKDQEITIIAVSGEWYHIRAVVDGEIVEGYSVSSYITAEGEPIDETRAKAVITAVELNVRKGPSTEYEKVEYGDSTLILKKDEVVNVFAEYDGWYYITYSDGKDNYNGFVKGTYVALEEGATVTKLSEDQLQSYVITGGGPEGEGGKESGKTDEKDKNDKESGKTDEKDKSEKEELEPVIPEGYIQVERIINSKFNISGTVTASKLNVRKLSKKSSDVVTVLKKGDVVTVINSVTVTTGKDSDSPVKTRWYRIVVPEEGSFKIGYVVEDYLELDYTGGISAFTKYDKQKLKVDPDKKTTVKKTNNKKLKIAKGENVTVIGEKISSSGDKFYEVSYTLGDNVYTGFILTTDLNFNRVVPEYSVKFIVPIEEAADVEEIKGTEVKIVYEFEGANAVAINAPALMMHEAPSWPTPVIRDPDDNPVMIYTGDSLEVLSTVLEGDTLWCYVRHLYAGNEYKGYISKEHVAPDPSLQLMSKEEEEALTGITTNSFEAKLASEGFPESYKDSLRALHELYPLWEFKAFHTGLTWKDVIDNEAIVGKNLIPNSKSIEWKSLDPGAYSYKTDSFVVFDGSTWVTASRDAIEYYMDPRNFLAQDTIFQFELLAYTPATQGEDAVKGVLKNTAMNEVLYNYVDPEGQKRSISFVDTFLMAAEYSGVSPLHLASRVKQEVTLGAEAMSNSVTGTVKGYEGLYNYYNIGAYHSTEPGGAIKNGLKFARDGSANNMTNINCLIPWNNQLRSIIGGAYYIGSNYINRGQNTIYLQKFNTTQTSTYMHQYMANVEAPWAEGRRVFSAYEDPVGTPIVFMIPVYLDMPEEAAPYPVHKDNPNNWLKTLKVYDQDGNKLSLTPTLNNSSDDEYSIVVESTVSQVKVNANPVSELAKVISEKKYVLTSGMNRIVVMVRAQNGDVKEFVINIFKEGNGEDDKENNENDKNDENDEKDENDEIDEKDKTDDSGAEGSDAGDSEKINEGTTDPAGEGTTDPAGTENATDPGAEGATDPAGTENATNPEGEGATDPAGTEKVTDPTGTEGNDDDEAVG